MNSTLKALKSQNFGLKAGLLSTAKWAKQRVRHKHRAVGVVGIKPKQTTTRSVERFNNQQCQDSYCTQIAAHTYSFSLVIYPYFHRNIGRPENRYRIQILVGYGIPLLFIILTGIVEATGSVCSKWRPRFNEQSCFFSGYYFIFQIFLGCAS